MHECPRCHSEQIRRSKRKGLVERGFLNAVGLKPFRYVDSYHRFFCWSVKNSYREVLSADTFMPAESR